MSRAPLLLSLLSLLMFGCPSGKEALPDQGAADQKVTKKDGGKKPPDQKVTKKDGGKKKASASAAKPETRVEEKPTPIPAAPATPSPPPRRGTFGRTKPRSVLLSALASATETSPIVLAALKAAYDWTDKIRLTKREFLRRRDEWLKKPANEV